MQYQLDFLNALGLTILLETLVLYVLKQWVIKAEISWYYVLFAGVLASMATLPYLWFIVPLFIKGKVFYHIFSESFALLAESIILMGVLRIKYLKAFWYSLICNATSYAVGLLFF